MLKGLRTTVKNPGTLLFVEHSYIMSQSCRLFCGFILSFIGWIGLIIATATNDWVITCKYGMHTCKKMDELGSKGLWAECVVSTSLYHCTALNQILVLPGKINDRERSFLYMPIYF